MSLSQFSGVSLLKNLGVAEIVGWTRPSGCLIWGKEQNKKTGNYFSTTILQTEQSRFFFLECLTFWECLPQDFHFSIRFSEMLETSVCNLWFSFIHCMNFSWTESLSSSSPAIVLKDEEDRPRWSLILSSGDGSRLVEKRIFFLWRCSDYDGGKKNMNLLWPGYVAERLCNVCLPPVYFGLTREMRVDGLMECQLKKPGEKDYAYLWSLKLPRRDYMEFAIHHYAVSPYIGR